MSKEKYGYLLFDLPGDHEIEGSLATECMVIEAIIHNMRMKSRVKRICVASIDKFKSYPTYKYSVQFVHLACHGGKSGIGMLGGTLAWDKVARQVTRHLHSLEPEQQRVMVFSSCHSSDGFKATRDQFKDYFSAAYFFKPTKIPFAQAITTWSMFYLNKSLDKPHGAIVKPINEFFGEEVLVFKTYHQSSKS